MKVSASKIAQWKNSIARHSHHPHSDSRLSVLFRIFACIFLGLLLCSPSANAADPLKWSQLPQLPDEHGFAAPFAGVSQGALIVAGGANFPDGYPWEGGNKVWHDRIFVLESPNADSWKVADVALPKPLAYGVSVSVPSRDSLILVGGSNENGSHAEVYELVYSGDTIEIESLPALPVVSSMASGALLDGSVYVAGGTADGDSTLQRFFRLNLSEVPLGWEELPWPDNAPGRVLSVAGIQRGEFHLFSGADLGSNQWDKRTYLTDAYSFAPKSGNWRRLADSPRSVTAAPKLAIPSGQAHLLFAGGVTRSFANAQRDARPDTNGGGTAHPGFPSGILAYHTITNTWSEAGLLPVDIKADHESNPKASVWAPVTTTIVEWDGRFVIPTGEIKPGIRSPQMLVATIAPHKAAFGTINWIVVTVYLGGMIAIGWFFSKRQKNTENYFRGGQRIPWWVAGLSIFATMLSAITFMSIPAQAYSKDTSYYIGQLPVLLVVPLVVFCYLPFFRKLDVTSAYEYLEKRFGLAARLFASASFILYHIGRVAIVLYLPSLALSQVSSVSVTVCILVIGILCIIYTVMGGIEAVVWTDAVQALVLMGGALLCLLLVVFGIDGGFSQIWRTSVEDAKLFQSLTSDFSFSKGTTSWFVLFVAFTFNALVPYTSGQDVVQRYVTTPSEAAARRSLWTTMWMSVFGSILFFALGAAIYAFYKTHPGDLDPAMARNDGILPFFILQQLPVGVAGLIIAAIFAAAQSTVSSSLNSVATAYVTDFDVRVFRPGATEKSKLRVARLVVIVIGIAGIGVAWLIAYANIKSAFEVFQTIIGLAAGSLGGLFALGIFNRRANSFGALLGAFAGLGTVLALSFSDADISGLLYAFISFTTCFAVGSAIGVVKPAESDKTQGLTFSRK